MQAGDRVTIAGVVKCVHGTPETHAPELCSVQVEIPGGQSLWVNRANVTLAVAPIPDPVEEAKPKRGRHERKVVAAALTPEDGADAIETPEG
jgi:hypothetical protein